MATFEFNNGNSKEVKIDGKYDKTKLYLSVEISMGSDAIKIAGHTAFILAGKFSLMDVQFTDGPLDYAFNLYEESLFVTVDVSKFNPEGKELKDNDEVATCKLKLEAGDDLLSDYQIDDSSNPQVNSVFKFSFTFSK